MEVSELTGISMSNLRTRHQEGNFPDVETDSRGRRLYTAQEIDQIRHVMAKTGRNGETYLPGRRENDALQVISIVNFKGGSSLTTMFGYRPEIEFAENGTVYDALRYEDPVPLSQVIRKGSVAKLSFA
ncbi:MerR family transcriptional regulator [uncultured Sulfitobacter sp.]|uniref:MerR family transcriptional regulator n=1 Tax=uncultured Sulfitobacter sp. TaxID=191468 RepID=UPI002626E7C0|nr:MerR family transcriptional regulator [uncultured Sulfitobacter sp.]